MKQIERMKILLFMASFMLTLPLLAQEEAGVYLSFHPVLETSQEKPEASNSGNWKLEQLKFYISNIQLLEEEDIIYEEKGVFYLLDWEDSSSFHIQLDVSSHQPYSSIRFLLGVDSLTNVSGAFGGDLDPVLGMYWTWQSGYINVKLEGTSPDCPARENRFQFHIGGYQAPHATAQWIQLETSGKSAHHIDINIPHLLQQIDLQTSYYILSPGEKAAQFSKLLPSIFSVKDE